MRWNRCGGKRMALAMGLVLTAALMGCEKEGSRAASEPREKEATAASMADVRAACESIAQDLRQNTALTPQTSDGFLLDPLTGQGSQGCHVLAATPSAALPGGVMPDLALKDRMASQGWEGDNRYAADGADSTAFALRQGGVLCLFSAATSDSMAGDQVFAGAIYKLTADCAALAAPAVR